MHDAGQADSDGALAMQEMLDEIDRRILGLLQAEAALTAADVAAKVGLSQSPCWRRIARLEREGYIQRRVAVLDRRRLGLDVTVYVQVRAARGDADALAEFERRVREFPEVLECHMLMGEVDYLLKVVTRDVASFEDFLRHRLSVLPAVGGVRSSMALTPVKETTALPLELLERVAPSRR
jgi:Lrp/AsnC family transcriptional regulator